MSGALSRKIAGNHRYWFLSNKGHLDANEHLHHYKKECKTEEFFK